MSAALVRFPRALGGACWDLVSTSRPSKMEDPSSSQLEQKTERTGRGGSKVVASNYGKQKGRETNNDVIYAPRNTQVTRASARTMAHSQVERA